MRTLHRLLAATDFSPAGAAALARAGQLAAQHEAELRIVNATPDWNLFSGRSPMRQDHYDEISRVADTLMRRETTRLASELGIRIVAEVHRGRASEVIARAVEAYQPDLLIIGAHGEHAPPVESAALGSTTLKLISRVRTPLLLVRRPVTTPYRTSLAAIGTSPEHARRIVHWANTLAAGGDCHVVRAYEVPYLERLRMTGIGAEALSACSQDAELAARYAADPPWSQEQLKTRMHMHLVRGMPVPTVLTEIIRNSAQFAAIGRHQEIPHAAAHTLLGCTGVRIAYHSSADVLIVP